MVRSESFLCTFRLAPGSMLLYGLPTRTITFSPGFKEARNSPLVQACPVKAVLHLVGDRKGGLDLFFDFPRVFPNAVRLSKATFGPLPK